MSQKGLLTPNKVNVLTQLLQSSGLNINVTAAGFMGVSTALTNYVPGTIITETVLATIPNSISVAFAQIGTNVSQAVYDELIAIGSTTIPALGNSKPSTYLPAYSSSQARYGFLRMLPLQAHTDFTIGTGSYSDFISSFMTASNFANQSNSKIATLVNSQGYLDGVYSNMNDLITGDITGVSPSTLFWGQDLIATGRAINLRTISSFGLPSNLLKTLQANNALTQAVSIAMILSDLTTTELTKILANQSIPTPEQEKKLYSAFSIVLNDDLNDVMVPLNVQTKGLVSLADLLDPRKLFPNSFTTLTVPRYNALNSAANSKIYYLIYQDGSLNTQLNQFDLGFNLLGLIPSEIAVACGAFSSSMLQIKNISTMNIEKFSQVVTNLETTLGLTVNGTTTPVDQAGVASILPQLAKGSGPSGTYTVCDFFGSMTGIDYQLSEIQALITQLQTPALTTIYNAIAAEMLLSQNHNTVLSAQIALANAEIANIYNTQTPVVANLNTLWNNLGTRLTIEINARALALSNIIVSDTNTIYSFIDSLDGYALETQDCQSAPVLEAISDITTIGGQSLIASMRETRNASRLGLAGGVLDNDISDVLPQPSVNGLGIPIVTGASQTPGSFAGSPEINLIPQNLGIFNISATILPSTVIPSQAIADTIACNCDCWDNL